MECMHKHQGIQQAIFNGYKIKSSHRMFNANNSNDRKVKDEPSLFSMRQLE